MAHQLSFQEIDEFWDRFIAWPPPKDLSALRNAHKVIKKMWDGQKRPASMKMEDTLLSEIRKCFPKDPQVRTGRPMGNFRDLMADGISHEDAYDDQVERLKRLRKDKDGELTSFLDELWWQADALYSKHFKTDKDGKWITKSWNRELYTNAMLCMMYSSTIGIVLEHRAHGELEEWLAAYPKAAKIFKYEPAANHLESKDVDGVFRHIETGEIAVKLSIKTMGAFTEHWINTGYRDKGKTEPDIYAGYRSKNDEAIDFITVNDMSLKELLRKAV